MFPLDNLNIWLNKMQTVLVVKNSVLSANMWVYLHSHSDM
jgi:hypothetical protein